MNINNDKDYKESQKQYIRNRYQGAGEGKLEVISAESRRAEPQLLKKRVAVYARVSTDQIGQKTSIELQQSYYSEYIEKHEGWVLAGVYVDEGKSGTNTRKRQAFNRLIDDCRNGKIDMIITKNLSRFARNTLDCIKVIRELKTLEPPVGVLFATEDIYTLDPTAELVLSLLSAIAQEESHIKSDLANVSIEQRLSRGIFVLNEPFGYRKNKNKELVIVPKQAEIVKVCFYLYINGYTQSEISDILNKYHRTSKMGTELWIATAISGMLANEKYCGDILGRKFYTPSYLEHRQKQNKRHRNQYLQLDHHEAIVSREVYQVVQSITDSYKNARCPSRTIPVLKVFRGGLLHGFVTIFKNWTFSYKDYVLASQEAGLLEDNARNEYAQITDKDYNGYEVVGEDCFSYRHRYVMNIDPGNITFAAPCGDKLKLKVDEYFELLFHPENRQIVLMASEAKSHYKNKIFKRDRSGNPALIGGSVQFCRLIYELMGWKQKDHYKFYGWFVPMKEKNIIIFDLKDGIRVDISPNGIGNHMDAEQIMARPFGLEYMDYLKQAAIYDNAKEPSEVFVAQSSVKITDEQLNQYKQEAEAIIASWALENKEEKDLDQNRNNRTT